MQGFTLAPPRIHCDKKTHNIWSGAPSGHIIWVYSYMMSCKKSSLYWSKCHVFGIIGKLFKNASEWCSWGADILKKFNYHILPNKCTPWLLIFTGYISETTYPIWIIFSAHEVQAFRCSHCDFHWSQTRLRVRCLPPRPALLFSEIWYSLDCQMAEMMVKTMVLVLSRYHFLWSSHGKHEKKKHVQIQCVCIVILY